jgi:hypothetical protein
LPLWGAIARSNPRCGARHRLCFRAFAKLYSAFLIPCLSYRIYVHICTPSPFQIPALLAASNSCPVCTRIILLRLGAPSDV